MKRLKRRARRDDAGFTLIELVITIAIMAIITIPLGNFMLQYLTTYNDTQTRLSDSHDMQIAAAYFSQDVGNTGLRDAVTTTPKQSIWIPAAPPAPGGFPTTYCGSSLGGTTLLLLGWDDWSDVAQTGSDSIDSVSYFILGGTLHRVYCSGGTTIQTSTTVQSSTTVVYNIVYPDTENLTPVTCSTSCVGAPPPATVSFKLSIKGGTDKTVSYVTLSGQRRQATS